MYVVRELALVVRRCAPSSGLRLVVQELTLFTPDGAAFTSDDERKLRTTKRSLRTKKR